MSSNPELDRQMRVVLERANDRLRCAVIEACEGMLDEARQLPEPPPTLSR